MPVERSKEENKHHDPFLRGIGFLLVIIAVSVLGWDFYGMMTRSGFSGYFSSIASIIASNDKQILVTLEQSSSSLSPFLWLYIIKPVISVPVAPAFGIPGLIMVRRYAPGIQVRGATAKELEMQALGINPRHIYREQQRDRNRK